MNKKEELDYELMKKKALEQFRSGQSMHGRDGAFAREAIHLFSLWYDDSQNNLHHNPIEGFHRQLRKVAKTKGAFTSNMALLKLIYQAQTRISNDGP